MLDTLLVMAQKREISSLCVEHCIGGTTVKCPAHRSCILYIWCPCTAACTACSGEPCGFFLQESITEFEMKLTMVDTECSSVNEKGAWLQIECSCNIMYVSNSAFVWLQCSYPVFMWLGALLMAGFYMRSKVFCVDVKVQQYCQSTLYLSAWGEFTRGRSSQVLIIVQVDQEELRKNFDLMWNVPIAI